MGTLGLSRISRLPRLGLALAKRAGGQINVPLPAPKLYLIGAYQQPVFKHSDWKNRGANTLFVVPEGTTTDAWATSAKSLGLKQVRYPKGVTFTTNAAGASASNYSLSDPAAFNTDMASGDLLAAAFYDEPSDVKDGSGTVGYGHGNFDPSMMDAILTTWRGKGVPTWLNQLGNHVRLGTVAAYMRDFADGGQADWFACDSYPSEEGRTWPSSLGGRYTSDQGHDIEIVRDWSSGRPQMTFIGTSKQFTNFNQPTSDQVAAQIYSGIIHGAFGHCYFPIVLTPSFSFDGTPQNVLDRLAVVHAFIASIHDNVLIDTANGGRRPYLLRPSVLTNGATPTGLQLPFGVEGAEITCGDGRTYRMLLNLGTGAVSVTDSRWGLSALSIPGLTMAYGYTAAEMVASVAAPVYAALQSAAAAKSTNIALTNSNRTATISGAGDYYSSVIGDKLIGSRKVYFEITTSGMSGDADQSGVGLTTSTTKLAAGTRAGGTAVAVVVEPGNGKLEANNFSPQTVGAAGDGTFGFAVDGAVGKVWVRKGTGEWFGANANHNPATNLGGYATTFDIKLAAILLSFRDSGGAATLNTGNASFVGTVPGGFGNL